jgi:transketolase
MPETRHVSDPGVRWAVPDPRELALRIRLRAVRMVAPQGFGYLGQVLSSAEQVAAVFAAARPGVDRIVCSPGHYIIGPFAAAAELGLASRCSVTSPRSALCTARSTSPRPSITCARAGRTTSTDRTRLRAV